MAEIQATNLNRKGEAGVEVKGGMKAQKKVERGEMEPTSWTEISGRAPQHGNEERQGREAARARATDKGSRKPYRLLGGTADGMTALIRVA